MTRVAFRVAGCLAILLGAAPWSAAFAQDELPPTSLPPTSQPPTTQPAEVAPPAGGDKFPLPDVPAELGQAARAVRGSLAVRATQGTPGGPPIGALPVTVELYHRGMLFNTIDAQLDEHGVTVLEDLPAGMDVQPVVRVVYKDMTYQKVGAMMNADNPQQSLDVVCYEPTNDAPEWSVRMWHVMADRRPPGLFVTEIIVVENPGERTWLGTTGVGPKPITTSFALHEQAKEVALGPGFHDWCCTTHTPGSLVNHLPLMPEATEFRFSYLIPAEDDSVALDIVAPAPADHVMVVFPDDIKVEHVDGFALSGTDRGGPRPVVAYTTANLGRGQKASLVLAGLGTPPPLGDGSGGAAGFAKIAAAVGGALLLMVAVVIVLARSGKSASAESWPS
ncbi:MAG: hypothetical protein ACYS15_20575 [Planctomycetota bacterium]|jgi:hypothetical protein